MSEDKRTTDQIVDQAVNFKKYLVDYLGDYFDKNKTDEISLQDITCTVVSSHYGIFLREFFKIDTRSLLKRVHLFILSYPDQFVVDYERGMVRFTNGKDLQNLKNSIIDRCCDFLILCLSFQPTFMIPMKQLHDYLKYSAVDVEDYLNDFEYFKKFLKVYPDLFYLDDDYVCSASAQKKMELKKFDITKMENTRIDDKLIEKVIFIDNLEKGKRIRDHILSSVKLIAMDTEGTHLGEDSGQLTLFQVAFINPNVKLFNLEQKTIIDDLNIYFFDIMKCEALVKECIEPILEREDIIKVFHDTRNDFAALTLYFSVTRIMKVFDSSKVYNKLTGSKISGLHTVYEEITGLTGQNLKPKMRQFYAQNYAVWESRPLTNFLKFYAAMDVFALISIYLHLDKNYDLKQHDDIYSNNISKPKNHQLLVSSNCVNFEDNDEKQAKKKKKKNKPMDNKLTPNEIALLKEKVEYLERIARGEIRLKDH